MELTRREAFARSAPTRSFALAVAVALALAADVPYARAQASLPPAPPAAALSPKLATPVNPVPPAPAGPGVRAPPARRPRPKPVDDAPPLPPAEVILSIDAPSPRGPWVLRVMNNGDVPVRVVADARLLSLDVTERSAPKARHCELPEDMRPADPLERSLVLPPKRAYAETFEPRLYCFDGKLLDALSSGSLVVARLGLARAGESAFAVAAIDGVLPQVGDRRVLESLPFRLPDEAVASVTTPHDMTTDGANLSLVSAPTVDALSVDTIEIPLTLRNGGSRPLVVRFRPEMLSFDLVRPSGVEHCAWPTVPAAALAESFAPLPPKKGSLQLVADIDAYCRGPALSQGGLIAIWPKLDTRNGSGQGIGVRSFDGQVAAVVPTIVRLHHGRLPPPLTVPQLGGP
jgi:hypothetical protein